MVCICEVKSILKSNSGSRVGRPIDNRPQADSLPYRIALILAMAWGAAAADLPYYAVASGDGGAWPAILGSVGFERHGVEGSRVVVAGGAAAAGDWAKRVEGGTIVILEGASPLAESFGFRATTERVRAGRPSDVHNPGMAIIWQARLDVPVFETPSGAIVFARDEWSRAALEAGVRIGRGAVLWTAVSPGQRGYERFPYLLQALIDLGLEMPYRSARLWAFFDSAYRSRADLDYFATRWRKAGISALHVAAWHFFEPSAEQDDYLKRLIEACHREGVLVYAWMDMPHVSEEFWAKHPEWREKTALLQDAHLDWRKLMNLTNRDCFQAVSAGLKRLINGFDWDGINLAELYFESLEGMDNPSRFTPMNDDVRALFRREAGFDPLELFHGRSDEPSRRMFLDFRMALARRMQGDWIREMEEIRQSKPELDLVLTHVDDGFDPRMRDAIGADAANVLPLLDSHDFTFLVEDPATVWGMGPDRYRTMAERYRELTKHTDKLAIDINIVERYQDVYPTKQQTGTELFQLVHLAASAFPRVALYFENSILQADLPLLSAAAAPVDRVEQDGSKVIVESRFGVGMPWEGPAVVNSRAWPVRSDDTLWLPAGRNVIEPAQHESPLRILDFNGNLRFAEASGQTLKFTYQSNARAIAVLNARATRLELDGVAAQPIALESGSNFILSLPRGQHVVQVSTAPMAAAYQAQE